MKAIVRNVLLACLISTFAFFGAIGNRHTKQAALTATVAKQPAPFITEAQKETFTCLGVAFLAWVLCFWRCGVINRRLNQEREYMQRFTEHSRTSSFHRQC
ncbi:hypothetical protein [Mucilaginibacter psychrotolerans]|uniref:CcmD family protein n=1 Tax=Mucilaginibacter psychrotolerans TaxID=1524096 RepID=A0A4Y8SG88_9SPHI|nr:hypothetical protein [Mucilaginibacter psychrotolerans]TFF37660.1 hypothetical protein E2R66_10855 [Mucilaginibacter psychrotolerans]